MFGICIVTFGSEDVIGACLEGLRRSEDQKFKVVIIDNASTDSTCGRVLTKAADAGWSHSDIALQPDASGATAGAKKKLTLLRSSRNLGYAGGVNRGLEALMTEADIRWFWVLNPDSEPMPSTIADYRHEAEAAGEFALMGGRTLYYEAPNAIQSDGGRVHPWTGICSNVNQGRLPQKVNPPAASAIDFISGANVVASRLFLERVGLMREDYFLFYEEVDWAKRRGNMPLVFCAEAVVLHHGGTAIGSGSINRRASGFANYFNYRNRLRFVWRFTPYAAPAAYFYSSAKIVHLLLLGAWREAVGAFRGLNQLQPPSEVYQRISWPPARHREGNQSP